MVLLLFHDSTCRIGGGIGLSPIFVLLESTRVCGNFFFMLSTCIGLCAKALVLHHHIIHTNNIAKNVEGRDELYCIGIQIFFIIFA